MIKSYERSFKLYFHLSCNPNLKILTPKIPECAIPERENVITPRICFSDSISKCLSALQSIPCEYYVYTPTDDIELYSPTVDEVRDVKIHSEKWCLTEVEVKLLGKIQSYEYVSTRTYRDWETDRKSTRLNSSHSAKSRMPSSA